ncbi:MAG: NAD-dependent epimerase/dehydratase family protein, partial [Gammaproteobacteria bacterium]|nr:NAD-dependent epimerase/dehydratase family protein [Gammaproteobacteria bacterium]
MNIAITGSAGLIGSYLREHLKAAGHHVMPIIRTGTPMRKGGIFWDPESGWLDMDPMVRYDAVIHLAGENIAHRWTGEKKIDIYHSRVDATRLLCKTLAIFPPKLFICASAVGFYGDCDDEVLDETHPPGEGFLANLCVDWEAAAHEIADHSRVVSLRFGMVLSKKGGALKKMIGVFRLAAGGPLGDGQ